MRNSFNSFMIIGLLLLCASAMAQEDSGFTIGRVNVRACPSTSSCSVVEVLSPRSELRIIGKSGDWLQVVTVPDKKMGWVSSKYVGHELKDGFIKNSYPPDARELTAISRFNLVFLFTAVVVVLSGIVMIGIGFRRGTRPRWKLLVSLVLSPRMALSWVVFIVGAYCGWFVANKVPLEWSTLRGGISYLPKLFGYISWVLYWGVPSFFRLWRRVAFKLLTWGFVGVVVYVFVLVIGFVMSVYYSVLGGGLWGFIMHCWSLGRTPAAAVQILGEEIPSGEVPDLGFQDYSSDSSRSLGSGQPNQEELDYYSTRRRLELEIEQLEKSAEEKEAWEKRQVEVGEIRKGLETPDWQ